MGNENNPSTVPGGAQGDEPENPQPNVGNSSLQGEQSPSIEALKAQIKKLEDEAFKRREADRKRREQEQQAEAARLEQLQRNGEFEQLTKTQQAAIDELKAQLAEKDAEIAKRDYDALRAKVATKHGLPAELAARLVGQTEEELNADAAQLKKLIPTLASPGNAPNPKPASNTPEDLSKHYEKKLRASGSYFKI
jgi:hypothetical protein